MISSILYVSFKWYFEAIKKEKIELNYKIDHNNLKAISKTFYPTSVT